ncbi:hypothetical protein [Acinetobacter sp. ABJ_C5_2]|uniref:hypothetical protein n=1 Tax=Acinetobacter sp. ABJ_C5_2 TaxID=3376992 RepID=UPI0037C6B24C
MKIIRHLVQLCLLLLFLPLTACSGDDLSLNNGNKKTMNSLTLYFNKETGAQFATRTQAGSSNPLPTSQTTFYNLDWNKHPIDVLIDHGKNSITLHHVIGVQTATAGNYGIITSYNNISAGLSNDDTISHDQARLAMLAILKDLRNNGWQRFIRLSEPRLTGKDALDYAKKELYLYALDPDYVYTLDEWMQLEDGVRWMFQANGIYLTIQMYREQSKMDPKQPGEYFVRYEIVSEKEFYAPYFKDDDLKKWEMNAARWVSLYPGIKKEMNQIRAKTEAELKVQGVQIDTSYQDPALVSKK